ncbi:SRPBCC family protein [Amycolatopsis rhabdoformis]|uniref:SRPBCC family protein n=1 Tax=Amycolatopsis rhabdoformis TaxID=1448059 RepID=A0ABZ1IJ88_9PSEU|nr:SRPBCC family protein [Amycolatopsis rhabdoformis]WSE34456.1 SRPBCC family protein [Amycolatopsis rhabdoformis]
MQRISVRAHTPADPATVYALLRDGSSWPRWSPLGSFSLLREGPSEREGLGALRVFRTGRTRSCEEVIALEPDRRFGYALRSGLPLRGYVAYVDLAAASGGGTEVHWHSSFRAKVPGTGWFYRLVLGRFIARVVAGLVAETSRVAS